MQTTRKYDDLTLQQIDVFDADGRKVESCYTRMPLRSEGNYVLQVRADNEKIAIAPIGGRIVISGVL